MLFCVSDKQSQQTIKAQLDNKKMLQRIRLAQDQLEIKRKKQKVVRQSHNGKLSNHEKPPMVIKQEPTPQVTYDRPPRNLSTFKQQYKEQKGKIKEHVKEATKKYPPKPVQSLDNGLYCNFLPHPRKSNQAGLIPKQNNIIIERQMKKVKSKHRYNNFKISHESSKIDSQR